jgi:hypothetical protein
MTTSLTTSDVRSISRGFRDLQLGDLTASTVPAVAFPDAETSSEIH